MGSCISARIKSGNSPHNDGKDTLPSIPIEGEILQSPKLESFQFSELKAATRNFSPESVLGQGGFGVVFKGWIDEHSLKAANYKTGMAIAVKMLAKNGFQGQQEWLAEIKYLGQLCHPNLVKLIGYCIEVDKRLLVYEFMSKGSLDNHLYRRVSHSQPLAWNLRMKVALGAAKALVFLHNKAQVIYRDFKTSNILLDSNYNAKLCDFGLAKDGPIGDKSHVTTRVIGTRGYVAPEYNTSGHLTIKVDVYSFGVVLLELISGRPAIISTAFMEEPLVVWAMPFLSNKYRIFRIFDASLEGKTTLNEALKAANLAVQCLSTEPSARPNMEQVVMALEQIILEKC